MFLPGMWQTFTSHFDSASKILASRGGAEERGFFMIAEIGKGNH